MGKDTGKTTRAQRSIALYRERGDEITRAKDGTYRVPGSNGERYVVDLDRGYCSCPDRTPADETDKHIIAAQLKDSRDRCRRRARRRITRHDAADSLAGLTANLDRLNEVAERISV